MQTPTATNPPTLRAIKAALIVTCLTVHCFGQRAGAAESPQPVLSTLKQLYSLVVTNGRAIASFQVQGVVCAVPRSDGMIVLQDDSATLLLELPPLNRTVKAGDNLILEGINSTLTRNDFAIQVNTAPVVDADGSHGILRRSGATFLKSGAIPIRVEWFNDYGPGRLQIEYEGPGMKRRNIPASVLLHRVGDDPTTEEPQLNPGLEYVTYVGSGWKALPDFQKATEAGKGIAEGFDITRRARADQCALVFSGYLQVPESGKYTFHVSSDDGCRIFVGDPLSHCRVSTGPDVPREIRISDLSETISEHESQRWSKLEGKVHSVRIQAGYTELGIRIGPRLVTAIILNPNDSLARTYLPGANVRATGIYQCTWTADEIWPGRLLVPRPQLLQILDSTNLEGGSGTITAISQIRGLSQDEARKRAPVRIRGIITTATYSFCIVQDSTGGIYLPYSPGENWVNQPRPGELWEFNGLTEAGDFSPIVRPSSGMCLGQAALPRGVRPTWSEFQDGSLDADQVEIEAAVIDVSTNEAAGNTEITLLTRDGTVIFRVNKAEPLPHGSTMKMSKSLVGCVVSLRGVYFAAWDSETRLVKPRLFQLGNASISVTEENPQGEFLDPVKPVRDLFLFKSPTATWGRVKVAGVVLHSELREHIVSDGTGSIRVYTREPSPVKVGDLVETVGFPQIGGPSPTLLEARLKCLGSATLPRPDILDTAILPDRSHDANLVQIEALLLNDTLQQTERVLDMQAGQIRFLAKLAIQSGPAATLRPGTLVQLTGVYSSLGSRMDTHSLDAFELLLNRPSDIVVLRQAPWWTPRRILTLAMVMAIGMMLALAWAALLRRTVARRTQQLKQEIENRQIIEQHRLLEQERSRVAQDLHDELGARLAEVGILGTLANNPDISREKQQGYLNRLAELGRVLVRGLDEIVWAINPKQDTDKAVTGYLLDYAQDFLQSADILCCIEVDQPWPERVFTTHERHQLLLAFKEALTNVVKHAEASKVCIRIGGDTQSLWVSVEDNGQGVKQNHPEGDGLINMSNRMKLIGGECEINTRLGGGTTVTFRMLTTQKPKDV